MICRKCGSVVTLNNKEEWFCEHCNTIKIRLNVRNESDEDICRILENHEDERIRNLVMFYRDIKKMLIDVLNKNKK